jgi:hypothetical protein
MGLARKSWESVPADYLAETLMAVRVGFGERELWVPKSLIGNLDGFIEDNEELEVEAWWLQQNNLI